MQKYGGRLIHKSRDEFGDIEVIDSDIHRSLHFGTSFKQSLMYMDNPHDLAASYARLMMLPLLFNSKPEKILVLGLGAGCIPAFLFHHFPGCHIDVVEYRQKVRQVAHGYFQLPEDSRINIIELDAAMFVRSASFDEYTNYDIIFIDLFDESGPATAVSGADFFTACRSKLRKEGILSINAWGSQKDHFRITARDMMKAFDTKVLFTHVRNYGNIVGTAFNGKLNREILKKAKQQIKGLQKELNIEFEEFWKYTEKDNTLWFER